MDEVGLPQLTRSCAAPDDIELYLTAHVPGKVHGEDDLGKQREGNPRLLSRGHDGGVSMCRCSLK